MSLARGVMADRQAAAAAHLRDMAAHGNLLQFSGARYMRNKP